MRTTITVYTVKGTVILRFALDLMTAFDASEEAKSNLRDLWELSRKLLERFARADSVECCQLSGETTSRLITSRILPSDDAGHLDDAVMIGARILRENVLRFDPLKPSDFTSE